MVRISKEPNPECESAISNAKTFVKYAEKRYQDYCKNPSMAIRDDLVKSLNNAINDLKRALEKI